MELYKALREIIGQRDASVVDDKILVNILDDYKGYEEAKGLKNILREFIEKEYSRKLLGFGGIDSRLSSLTAQFVINTGYNSGLSKYLVDSLTYGLGWTDEVPSLNMDQQAAGNSFKEIKHLEFRGVPLGTSEEEFIKGIEKVGFKKNGNHFLGYFHGEPNVELTYFVSPYTKTVISMELGIQIPFSFWNSHKEKYDQLVEDFSKKYKMRHNRTFYLGDYKETDSDQRKYEGLKNTKIQLDAKFESDYGIISILLFDGSVNIWYDDSYSVEKHDELKKLDV